MSDYFTSETEAISYLEQLVVDHSGVPAEFIAVANYSSGEITSETVWLLVNIFATTSQPAIFGASENGGVYLRSKMVLQILVYEPKNTGTGKATEVFSNMCKILNYGFRNTSVIFDNERSLKLGVESPLEQFTKTHSVSQLTFTFTVTIYDGT